MCHVRYMKGIMCCNALLHEVRTKSSRLRVQSVTKVADHSVGMLRSSYAHGAHVSASVCELFTQPEGQRTAKLTIKEKKLKIFKHIIFCFIPITCLGSSTK